ncbi:MAG: PIN domain-containing protein [Egibacteraceae bacterium]
MTVGLTLDTGALVAVERGDRRVWTALKVAVADKVVPVIPSPVLVEAWRGARQARLGQVLRHCRIEALDDAGARRAGELCGTAGTDDPVDAVVVASAVRRGDVVLTSDAGDLTHLASFCPGVVVLPVSSL